MFFCSCAPFCIPTSRVQGSNFPTALPTLVIFFFFLIKTILTGVRWYFIVDLICTSLMNSGNSVRLYFWGDLFRNAALRDEKGVLMKGIIGSFWNDTYVL